MVGIAIIMVITNEVSGKLLHSLPIGKKEIIVYRFIFMILSSIIFITYLVLIMYFLNSEFRFNTYIQSPNNILAFFNFNISTLAFLMPMGFLFTKGSINVMLFMFILFNGFSESILYMIIDYTLTFTIVTIILLICSFLMAIFIFSEREFG